MNTQEHGKSGTVALAVMLITGATAKVDNIYICLGLAGMGTLLGLAIVITNYLKEQALAKSKESN